MKSAVIYARYSSSGQNDASIDQQIHECTVFAERQGYHIVDTYADHALTGRTDARPAFQRMIADSAKHAFEFVICFSMDRFARNRYDSTIYKARLKKNGVKVVYATTSIPDGAEGIILESVLEGYAEYFSANLSEHVRRGLHDATSNHRAVHLPPFGYRINPSTHQYEPVPELREAVSYIFTQYANGTSTKEIIEWLNAHGYRSAKNQHFTRNSFSHILSNPMYIGTYRFGDVSDENVIEPTVDKTVWERVQQMIERNRRTKARFKADDEFILSGKLFCGECGSQMNGESGTSHTGAVYYYYKCNDRKSGGGCKKKPCRKAELEELVVSSVIHDLLTDETINSIADRTMELVEEEIRKNDCTAELTAQLSEIKTQKKRLVKFILMQDNPASDLNETLNDLNAQQKDLETRLETERYKSRITVTHESIVDWLTSFRSGDIKNRDFQKTVVNTLVNAVYVYDHHPDDDGNKDTDKEDILIVCNTTDHKTIRVKSSTMACLGTLRDAKANLYIGLYYCVLYIRH